VVILLDHAGKHNDPSFFFVELRCFIASVQIFHYVIAFFTTEAIWPLSDQTFYMEVICQDLIWRVTSE